MVALACTLCLLAVCAPVALATSEGAAAPASPASATAIVKESSASDGGFESKKLGGDLSRSSQKSRGSKARGGAQAPSGNAGASKRSSGSTLLRLVIGLALVLAAIWAVNRILQAIARRSGTIAPAGQAELIEILATKPLAAGRTLHVVRVAGEVVILGATDQQITSLGTVNSSVPISEDGFTTLLARTVASGGGTPAAATSTRPETADNTPIMRKVIGNLQMLTARD